MARQQKQLPLLQLLPLLLARRRSPPNSPPLPETPRPLCAPRSSAPRPRRRHLRALKRPNLSLTSSSGTSSSTEERKKNKKTGLRLPPREKPLSLLPLPLRLSSAPSATRSSSTSRRPTRRPTSSASSRRGTWPTSTASLKKRERASSRLSALSGPRSRARSSSRSSRGSRAAGSWPRGGSTCPATSTPRGGTCWRTTT